MYFLINRRQHEFTCYIILYVPRIALLLLVILPGRVYSTSDSFSKDTEICDSVDIRNTIDNFARLENCTVIEGYLRIVLIDKANTEDYLNLSFPKLREITGHLLLYRVANLTTLVNILPNLAVIRGNNLFYNYALVVYEMMSLQEIALPSLTVIVRGSVLIEKNPQLCYVDTINWDLISMNGVDGHYIKNNKEINQCPDDCPESAQCSANQQKGKGSKLCWNANHCQKVCTEGKCCDDQCLGGCDGTGPEKCFACKRVIYKGRCLHSCPTSTFEYANRRCVTYKECLAMNAAISWKLFNKKCLAECPDGYMNDDQNKTNCVPCNGTCPKECKSATVDSIAAAQDLKQRGCTKINGYLEIHISGGTNVVRELEENLDMITEVEFYVKIVRSSSLITLHFLKNLRKIRGRQKFQKKYALYIFDNNNLQELFDKQTTTKLEITSGRVLFYYNPKLCRDKIEAFLNFINFTNWSDDDVSPSTNGDRVACNISPLRVNITGISSIMVVVKWENFQKNLSDHSDHRSLLSYIISYKEAPFQNESLYEGRDACNTDAWKEDNVAPELNYSDPADEVHIVDGLKPFTQYALYIRTNTVAKEKQGAQSPIKYFTTAAATPTLPTNIKAISTDASKLKISWLPPSKPNGNVTHYVVKWYYQKRNHTYLLRRNYCLTPLIVPTTTTGLLNPTQTFESENKTHIWTKPSKDTDCCECPKVKTDLKDLEIDKEFEIDFENFLHDSIFIKRPSNHDEDNSPLERKRRSIPNSENPAMDSATTQSTTSSTLNSTTSPFSEDDFQNVTDTTSIEIENLHHFSEYIIEVVACHDKRPTGDKLCSAKAITTARTAPLSEADNINISTISVQVSNDTSKRAFLRWEPPKKSNGLIVTYHINYHLVNQENHGKMPICLTQTDYEKIKGLQMLDLAPGNYSVKISATSFAGRGNWTDPVYFFIVETSTGMNTTVTVILIVIGVIFSLFVGIAFSYFFLKRRFQKIPNDILYASVNPEYMSTIYQADEWEIPRDKVKLLRELGQGSFGMVYEGIAYEIIEGRAEIQCAVKTVNESASIREKIDFLNEASVMKAFSCHHVVKLYGVVSKSQPALVVMELMARGDLKSYLRSHRPEDGCDRVPPTLQQILQMACEIADGMAYLAVKKFVHRDLAARNCMVADDLTVKIGDFGMTRDIYETDYYRKGGKGLLPVRWMAPESLKDGVFTSQSDIWSYGIVLWEMATLASQPYLGLSNEQVLKYVMDGGIMERPENCPSQLYDMMSLCWNHNPKFRPSFLDIVCSLISEVKSDFHEVSFFSTQRTGHPVLYDTVDVDELSSTTPLKMNEYPRNNVQNQENRNSDESDDDYMLDRKSPSTRHTNRCKSNFEKRVDDNCKGSKMGDCSVNGGLANGHLPFSFTNKTEC